MVSHAAPAPPAPAPDRPSPGGPAFRYGDFQRALRAYAHLDRVIVPLTRQCAHPVDATIEIHLTKGATPDGAVTLQIGNVWSDWTDTEADEPPPAWDGTLAAAVLATLERIAQRWNELLEQAREWPGPETFNARITVTVKNGRPRAAAAARSAEPGRSRSRRA